MPWGRRWTLAAAASAARAGGPHDGDRRMVRSGCGWGAVSRPMSRDKWLSQALAERTVEIGFETGSTYAYLG